MNNKVKGALVATAVAGMFAFTACGGSTDNNTNSNTNANTNSDTKSFKCEGGNTCEGNGACNGEGHDCAGKNKCKGQGWVNTADEAACKKLQDANKS